MRVAPGQKILLVNGRSGEFLGKIVSFSKHSAEISIEERVREWTETAFIGLIFSPIRKIDLLAKLATELGTTDYFPFKSEFCQVKFNENRFLSNAIEAVEQSERLDAPKINPINSLKNILDDIKSEESAVFFCEERNQEGFFDLKSRKFNGRKPYALIGCEGGFSQREKELIRSYDFVEKLDLGKNILRTETACAAALSIINYWRN
jgi:16S rRNA (uracil1498-N3)-methyltransferase